MSRSFTSLLALAVPCVAAARAPLCFTAHAKTTLQCTQAIADGPVAVYDDSESPQKARTMHYRRGKLCREKQCKQCMAPGGAWTACSATARIPVEVMGGNRDWASARSVAFALMLVGVPVAVFLMLGKPAPAKAEKAAPSSTASGAAAPGLGGSVVEFLLRFASAPWFPLVAALGTAVNMFTIVFTGATVVIFLAAVLGARHRWPVASVANAAGATLGTAVLLLLVRERGLDYLQETFPLVLASPAWTKATGLMQSYGVGGMLLVSSMPIILHPVIAFGILSGFSNTTILAIVMAGRTVKYLVMGWVISYSPGALRFFGIKGQLLEYATAKTKAA